jgi:hypothetical protein
MEYVGSFLISGHFFFGVLITVGGGKSIVACGLSHLSTTDQSVGMPSWILLFPEHKKFFI